MAGLLLLLSTGCFQVEKSAPVKHQFILDVTRPGEAQAPESDAVLLVDPFQDSPPYEGKGLKYRKKDLTFESDFYNEFFTPPGLMISEEVVQWLSRSGLFAHVLSDAGTLLPTYTLDGTVQVIQGDYRAVPPRAVLEIEFVLTKGTGYGSKIVFQKTYKRDIPAPGGRPENLVAAWNKGLFEILESLEKDLPAVLPWFRRGMGQSMDRPDLKNK